MINPAKKQKVKKDEIFSSGKFFDVIIQVGDQTYKAHKGILSERCAYFANLLSDKNYTESKIGLIEIETFSADIILQLLRFIYNIDMNLNSDNVIDCYHAADQVTDFYFDFLNSNY